MRALSVWSCRQRRSVFLLPLSAAFLVGSVRHHGDHGFLRVSDESPLGNDAHLEFRRVLVVAQRSMSFVLVWTFDGAGP